MSPWEAECLGLDELTGLAGHVGCCAGRASADPAAYRPRVRASGGDTPPGAGIMNRAIAALGEPPSDPALAREVRAEVARDLVRDDDPEAGEALAAATCSGRRPPPRNGPGPGCSRRWGAPPPRYKDDKHLAIAADQLTMAARSYRNQGLWSWLAYTLAILGCWVHAHRGAFDQAVAAVDESPGGNPQQEAAACGPPDLKGRVLDQVGRYEEAEANLAEAEAIAQVTGDVRVRAYVSGNGHGHSRSRATGRERWRRSWPLSLPGRTGSTAAVASSSPMPRTSSTGWATATWPCSTCDRAALQSEHEDFEVERATAAVMARSGDPEEAERRLVALAASPWCEPVERWRVQLLRALAAGRRGDPAVASLALDALELAARLGHPGLPLIVERQAATSLLGLVAATGHPLATGLANMTFPVTVSLLGGFGVTRGGRAVDVPPGQGRQLVKLVAAGEAGSPPTPRWRRSGPKEMCLFLRRNYFDRFFTFKR